MYNFIVNPATGRKVNINNKKGRTILINYINLLKGSGDKIFLPDIGWTRRTGIMETDMETDRETDRETDMENLQSKISTDLWEQMVKSNNYNEIIEVIDNLRDRTDLSEHFNRERTVELVTEARRNYILQLVEDNNATMLDNNRILQTGNFYPISDSPSEYVDDETVVEFKDEIYLRRVLEAIDISSEDIDHVMGAKKFIFSDMAPTRLGFNGTLKLIKPIVRENGEEYNIELYRIEDRHFKITGRILKLDLGRSGI